MDNHAKFDGELLGALGGNYLRLYRFLNFGNFSSQEIL
jgi:hypothetical protein